MSPLAIRSVRVADDPDSWRAAGFTVTDDLVALEGLAIEVGGDGPPSWSWTALDSGGEARGDVAGIATGWTDDPPPPASPHEIGQVGIDHVVLASPDLASTTEAFEDLGIACRRMRDAGTDDRPFQQRFFRVGPVILELVGDPDRHDEGPASIWGLALTVDDLDAAVARLGPACGRAKDAVQPGRRIATVRTKDLGISLPVALLSPDPRSGTH